MATTDRLALPLLAAGQAQKEITHNEALALLDLAVQLIVESADIATPPADPGTGQCWIVTTGATGAWLDAEGAVAGWTSQGWLFLRPAAGWRAWTIDRGHELRFDGSAWVDGPVREDGFYVGGERVVSARQGAIADPTGGAVQDDQARIALLAILSALRTHGLVSL
ncbi:DUF2793 domain-containing protein [Sphingobium lignivorans]|uniref:DUF2793 domain-containing protein n=1 Tax=Sphingobium lignivorans TaxID=2735886 RepID=A0ABR6NJ32_9SPHN|nr:DUF2793 domain-containing protein [Sphingobium lignivorans]MBB5987288.1 hypothetical protein [Sphingobium lignivorans]